MSEELIILPDDDRAAYSKTQTIWFSRLGSIHTNEEEARLFGCTHKKCKKCDTLILKHCIFCEECRIKVTEEHQYLAMPFKEWDGITPVYSRRFQCLFISKQEIDEIFEFDKKSKSNMLSLVICEKLKSNLVDLDALIEDFPEECKDEIYFGTPSLQNILESINNLNSLLEKEEWGWEPGKFRTDYTPM